jgi:hypothetical protein
MDERKGHYSPAQLGAFLKVQLLAGRQTNRGTFRSVAALKAMLPTAYARHVDFLVDEGDLIVGTDGSVYVDGWNEWQEGDLTVRDRMARLRNRNRNSGVPTGVTPPSHQTEPPSPHTPLPPRVGDGVGVEPPNPPETGGRGLRANGKSPRQMAAEVSASFEAKERDRRDRRLHRHMAYLGGRITEAQEAEMNDRDAPLEELPAERGAAYARGAA